MAERVRKLAHHLSPLTCGGADIEDLGNTTLGGACAHRKQCSREGTCSQKDLVHRGPRHSADFLDDDEHTLFHPRRFVETTKPLLEASTLPREVYASQKWYDRELDRVFTPSWTLMGREDEVMEPGDYLALDLEWTGPIAVCRGEDGQLHGFTNVCCHRGAKVIQDCKGKAPAVGLVCPYHAWTYDFDGKLKFAPGTDANLNFVEDDIRMAPIRLEILNGFIFVCLDSDAPSLAENLGDLPEKLSPWFGDTGKASDMVCVERREYTVECNWKFIMENTCETYHTSIVHRDSLGPMKATPMDPHRGDWDAVRVPSERTIVPLPEDFKGENAPLPTFTDSTAFVNVFPCLQINVTWDCIWWMQLLPESPLRTKIIMGFCFPKATTNLPCFPEKLQKYLKRWHIAVQEDNAISLNQQRGLRSPLRVPGRFTQLEFGTHNFNNWLISKVLQSSGLGTWDPGTRVYTGEEMWSNDAPEMQSAVAAVRAAEAHAVAPRV